MKLFNTLTNKKEEFKPLKEGEVSIYVCGPTVYNYVHIGNTRPMIVFDVLRRTFEYLGNKVTFVSNFTDVDDKIIKAAKQEGITEKELTDKYIKAYEDVRRGLNLEFPTYAPRVTETMDQIISFIQKLVDKGYAYVVDGDVYFRVSKVKEYGELSGIKIEDLVAGASERVEDKGVKEETTDFALWKKTDEGIQFDSPWSKGRPGWHIECSCMAKKLLGETIDIHAGGMDLAFPHHENEIAQSEALTGKPFAKYWMHSAYLNVNNQKMSKSLNNFLTARDALKAYDGDVIRFLMLSAHYRVQLNFSTELLDSAKASVERLYNAIDNLENLINEVTTEKMTEEEVKYLEKLNAYKERYIEKMDDDFNTADAITVLFDLVRDYNTNITIDSSKELCEKALELIRSLGAPLGMLQKQTKKESLEDEIERLIEQRQEARKNRDFALADKIRDDLKARGIVLIDTPQGVRWKKEN